MTRMTLLVVSSLLAACAEEPIVPLVQVTEIAPRQVESGDTLEITGVAFPQGRKARLSFTGLFHRPGVLLTSPDTVDLEGVVAEPSRIVVAVDDAFIASFCGPGAAATHTTFDGSLTVVFAGDAPGAPPVSGRLEHAVFDVVPTAAGQARFLADGDRGRELLHSEGMTVDTVPGGLVVTTLEPSGSAARSGVRAGDVIVAAGGVHTFAIADLAPPPGVSNMEVTLRSSDGSERHGTLPIANAQAPSRERFRLAALVVAFFALSLVLLAAAPARYLVWLRRRVANARLARRPFGWAQLAGVATTCAVPLFAPGSDVALLTIVVLTGALAVVLVLSGWRAALVTASRSASVGLALALALAIGGSLRADEVTAGQGAAPWSWLALRSPAHLALAVVACSWPLLRGVPNALGAAFDRFVSALVLGLVVFVFFGGWALPWLPAHPHDANGWTCVAVAVKLLLLSTALLRIGDALPPASLGALVRFAWLRLLPVCAVAGMAAALWEHHVASRLMSGVLTLGLAALGAMGAIVVVTAREAAGPRADPLA